LTRLIGLRDDAALASALRMPKPDKLAISSAGSSGSCSSSRQSPAPAQSVEAAAGERHALALLMH
jgi:hypothetical protein